MKNKLTQTLIISAITTVTTLTGLNLSPQPSLAANQFYCATYKGIPTTFSRTPRGKVALIQWVYGDSEYTPARRCSEVSERFQTFKDNGQLKYFGTGNVNNSPVICGVSYQGEQCNQYNVLITLRKGQNRYQIARKLLGVGKYSQSKPLRLNDRVEVLKNGENYYDVERLLQLKPVVKD
jgi:Circadian oscillating protein COP23